MLRKIPMCLLFCLAACTIIPDDAVQDFPKNVLVNQLTLRYYNRDTGEYKNTIVKVVRGANKIEINWPADVEIFFYNKDMVKTTYQLNNAGHATSITTTFEDGKSIVDELVYDGKNRVTELKNSFFNDNLKFFYSNNQLDSISKIRTLPNMTTQSGFYKRVNESSFISIFPFNTAQSYSLSYSFYGNCECTSNVPVPNELNKTGYSYTNTLDSYFSQYYIDLNYTQNLNNQYCKQIFSSSASDGNKNFYGKPVNFSNYNFYCYTDGSNFLSNYLLLPEVTPEFLTLRLATAESEIKWIKSNSATTPVWSLESIDYSYAPTSSK